MLGYRIDHWKDEYIEKGMKATEQEVWDTATKTSDRKWISKLIENNIPFETIQKASGLSAEEIQKIIK